MARFLFVEDDKDGRAGGMRLMKAYHPNDEFVCAEDYASAVKALSEPGNFDGVLSDLDYTGATSGTCGGLDLLAYMRTNNITTEFVNLFCILGDYLVKFPDCWKDTW